MVSGQCKSKDMAQTLFIRESEVKGMSQVVTVSMEDLQLVGGLGSYSEEEVMTLN
jgi:hypothetical protein